MISRIQSLLDPPHFRDEEKNRLTGILNIILLTILIILVIMILFTTAVGFVLTPMTLFFGLLCLLVAYVYMRRGYLRVASLILIITMLVGVTFLLMLGNGVHDEAIALLPIIIIIASLLFKDILYYLFSGLVILATGLVTILDYYGLIDTGFSSREVVVDYCILVAILVITAVTIRVLSNNLNDSLKRARDNEKALQESEEQYRNFIAQSSEGIWRIEYKVPIHINLPLAVQAKHIFEDGYVAECNEAFAKMYGYGNSEEVVGMPNFERYASQITFEDRMSIIERYITNDYRIEESESEIIKKSGEKIYTAYNAVGILKDDHLVATWGIQRNITELKRAETALRQSEEEARSFQKKLQLLHAVTTDLAGSETLEMLCRRVIELGRERLGFDRLGLLLFDEQSQMMMGTFGTDEHGRLRDEYDFSRKVDDSEILEILTNKQRLGFWQDAPLYDAGEEVGRGWNAMAVVWDGDKGIGWLATDNLIRREPVNDLQLELLSLYGVTVGHLISRFKTEKALRENEATTRHFQQKLRVLQEVNIQLQHISNLDELYKQAIELGISKLGFERLGLILYDAEKSLRRHTYGTDEKGEVYDERAIVVEAGASLTDLLQAKQRWLFHEKISLWSNGKVVGEGWNGIAILWNGNRGIGWLASDNLISQAPPPAYLPEFQMMYADILGHVITRLQTEETLRQNEARARHFQEQLQTLHEVSIELAQINILEDLYFQAVYTGLHKLGFERLGLLLYDQATGMMFGTFGTDDKGNIVDERDYAQILDNDSSLFTLLRSKHKRINFLEDAALYNEGKIVGRGWRATSVLWNGQEGIGWLSADALVTGKPPQPDQLEILSLLSATLGNLITRLQANEALEQSEQEAIRFQEKLQILHEISLDLAGADSLEELYRLVIEYGRSRLGFDRLGLFLYDRETRILQGVLGTDPMGNLIDESHYKQVITEGKLNTMLHKRERLVLWDDVVLTDHEGPIGRGWNAMSVLWNGKEGIGMLAADNLIRQEPVTPMQLEILTLYSSTIGYLITLKQSEEALKIYAAELERSNRELQEFAYVSSHDLQEPLRKIQTFGDRLSNKYAAELDENGLDYLRRMQDAASRMQILIRDLLAYSRVNTKIRPFESVDLNKIVQEVLGDLEIRIEETGAHVSVEELPIIQADRTQMHQLFQNLISNALKFHRVDVPPRIEIAYQIHEGVVNQPDSYHIIVKDNGIGFDDKYNDRIFVVFQRLHGRHEFAGSGVGLAICRRIVERHGGQIIARGKPNSGATFTIILPKK